MNPLTKMIKTIKKTKLFYQQIWLNIILRCVVKIIFIHMSSL